MFRYILRAVVWNTTDVTLDETSITGEDMSDIYLKGYIFNLSFHDPFLKYFLVVLALKCLREKKCKRKLP